MADYTGRKLRILGWDQGDGTLYGPQPVPGIFIDTEDAETFGGAGTTVIGASGYQDEDATPASLEFPTSPVPQYPLVEGRTFKTRVTTAADGTEKRAREWDEGRKSYILTWNVLEQDDIDTLWDFYVSAQGKYRAFVFYDPYDGVTSLGNFRFAEDALDRQNFEALLWSVGLEIIEEKT